MRHVDLRTLEMDILSVEDEKAREALLSILQYLRHLESRTQWIEDHAEGVH